MEWVFQETHICVISQIYIYYISYSRVHLDIWNYLNVCWIFYIYNLTYCLYRLLWNYSRSIHSTSIAVSLAALQQSVTNDKRSLRYAIAGASAARASLVSYVWGRKRIYIGISNTFNIYFSNCKSCNINVLLSGSHREFN